MDCMNCFAANFEGDLFCAYCGSALVALSFERVPIPPKVRFAVFNRDGFACRYCGRMAPEVELHVDHVIPVARGGTNDLDNLITACVDCNVGKGTTLPDLHAVDTASFLHEEFLNMSDKFMDEQTRIEDRQSEELDKQIEQHSMEYERVSELLQTEAKHIDRLGINPNHPKRLAFERRLDLDYKKLEWKHADELRSMQQRQSTERQNLAVRQVAALQQFRARRAVQAEEWLMEQVQDKMREIRAWGGDAAAAAAIGEKLDAFYQQILDDPNADDLSRTLANNHFEGQELLSSTLALQAT